MTAKQVFEGILYELNKVEAPSFELEDFNYFVNKAINNYLSKRYNVYDSAQQTTDDLSALSATLRYTASTTPALDVAGKRIPLPDDYFHLLNCLVTFKALAGFKCYSQNDLKPKAAKRLTADMFSFIQDDYYNRPDYRRPYYYVRDGVIELRTGVHSLLSLDSVVIDYLRTPEIVELLQSDVDDPTVDNSQVLQFPHYVCQEIIKETTLIFLENAASPRMQSHVAVNRTIPDQLPPTSAGQRAAEQPGVNEPRQR